MSTKTSKVVYCWSTNEEGYSGQLDSREEAAIEGIIETNALGNELEVGGHIYTAIAKPVDLKRIVEHAINIDNIFDNIGDIAYEEGGEWVDTWPEKPKKGELVHSLELEDALVSILKVWLNTHRKPTWYMACEAMATKITAEMLEQAK